MWVIMTSERFPLQAVPNSTSVFRITKGAWHERYDFRMLPQPEGRKYVPRLLGRPVAAEPAVPFQGM